MGKVIRVLLVLAVVAAVIGHFRGWYSVSRVDEPTTTDIRVRIDRERIRQDLDVARERVDEMTDQLAPPGGEGGPPADALNRRDPPVTPP